ncbi:MAG: hypothetical protein QGH45_20790 [Myxococcota bacterium]|jgi:nucleoside phosphorylase|nr:hypothetical protein [Myxococcota bacterium]
MNGAEFVVALRLEDWAFGGPCFCCGAGPRRARHRTVRWIRGARPAAVVNVGICGGMGPELPRGALVLVESWIGGPAAHGPLRHDLADALAAAGIEATPGRALTVAEPLIRPADKERAHSETGALICEMEGLAIAEACAAHGVPFAALRAVADDRDTVLRRPPRMLPALSRALLALRLAGRAIRHPTR